MEGDNKFNEVVTAPQIGKGTDFHVPSNEALKKKADNKQVKSRVYDFQGDKNTQKELYKTDDVFIDPNNDPRNVDDLLKDNMHLKESMIEQIMTMEQYKNIAYMWYRESVKLGKIDKPK
jgi:hypothetical protein